MQDYESNHRTKEDVELIEIAFFDKRKYEKEAVASAKKIIKERNLSTKEIDELKLLIRKRRRQERREHLKMVRKKRGFWGFVLEIFISGIGS